MWVVHTKSSLLFLILCIHSLHLIISDLSVWLLYELQKSKHASLHIPVSSYPLEACIAESKFLILN
jgi:hypothetical protein